MERLVVMGVDAHLDTLAAAVLDETGRQIAGVEVANTGSGWAHIEAMCVEHSVIVVGIEGASSYGHRLAQTLHSAGIEVREMPTRLTAATRRVDGAGKTDPGDARAIARAVAR